MDSTLNLTPLDMGENTPNAHRRFNTTCFSANQTQNRAIVIGDSNISSPALNTGISVCYAPPRGTGSDEGEEFLESPTQTTPNVTPCNFSRFTVGAPWVEGVR